jgi:hypothetical protein
VVFVYLKVADWHILIAGFCLLHRWQETVTPLPGRKNDYATSQVIDRHLLSMIAGGILGDWLVNSLPGHSAGNWWSNTPDYRKFNSLSFALGFESIGPLISALWAKIGSKVVSRTKGPQVWFVIFFYHRQTFRCFHILKEGPHQVLHILAPSIKMQWMLNLFVTLEAKHKAIQSLNVNLSASGDFPCQISI